MARHNTQNGQKCCDSNSPFKSTVHKGYYFPCSMIITQFAHRRIGVPNVHAPQRRGLRPGEPSYPPSRGRPGTKHTATGTVVPAPVPGGQGLEALLRQNSAQIVARTTDEAVTPARLELRGGSTPERLRPPTTLPHPSRPPCASQDPFRCAQVLLLTELLSSDATPSPFRDALLRALLLKFATLPLALALIRLCLLYTPEFQGSLGFGPEPLPAMALSPLITVTTPPSLLSLLDALLTRSEQELQAALTDPPRAPSDQPPFAAVLSAIQSALVTLASHRPADPSAALYTSVLLSYAQVQGGCRATPPPPFAAHPL